MKKLFIFLILNLFLVIGVFSQITFKKGIRVGINSEVWDSIKLVGGNVTFYYNGNPYTAGSGGTGDFVYADSVYSSGSLETQFRADSAKENIRDEIMLKISYLDTVNLIETQHEVENKLNLSTAGYIPYTNTGVDGYSYDSLFKYTAASSILDVPYTLNINSRSAGTGGVADAKPAYLRFRDGEEDIMAELYTSSVTGNLILATRISGGEIQSLDGFNISSGSLSLQSGESVNNIQATIGDSDVALPTSGAVVDYVADNLDSIFHTITLTPISDVGSPAEGEMYYDSDDNIAKIWNGTAWDTLNVVGTGSSGTGSGTIYLAGNGLLKTDSTFSLGDTLTDAITYLDGEDKTFRVDMDDSFNGGRIRFDVTTADSDEGGVYIYKDVSGTKTKVGESSINFVDTDSTAEVVLSSGSTVINVRDSGSVISGDFYFPDLADTADSWLLVSANTGKVDTGQLVQAKLGLEETMPNYKHWLKDRKNGEIKWPYLEDGEIVWKYGINDVKQFQFNIQATIEIILRKQYKQQIHAWINTGILTLVMLILLFFIVFIVRQLI